MGGSPIALRVGHSEVNRPFPSSKKFHFQSEAKCEAIDMKMIFNYDADETHFHNKGFALSLVLKVRCFGTRKWPIKQSMPVFPTLYILICISLINPQG